MEKISYGDDDDDDEMTLFLFSKMTLKNKIF